MNKDELFNNNIPRVLKARLIVESGVSEEIKKKWLQKDKEGLELSIKVNKAIKRNGQK